MSYYFTVIIGLKVDTNPMWERTKIEVDNRCDCMKETPEEFDGSQNFCPFCGNKIGSVHKKEKRTLKKQFCKYYDVEKSVSEYNEEFVFFDTYNGPKLNGITITCFCDFEDPENMIMGVTIASKWNNDGDEPPTKPPKWPSEAELRQYLKTLGFKPIAKTYGLYQLCRYC